jgi:hypothetical protein
MSLRKFKDEELGLCTGETIGGKKMITRVL